MVAAFLAQRFPDVPLVLPARAYAALVQEAARLGILGGSVYDALIAACARHADATLLTRDVRARGGCDRLGVRCEFVG